MLLQKAFSLEEKRLPADTMFCTGGLSLKETTKKSKQEVLVVTMVTSTL